MIKQKLTASFLIKRIIVYIVLVLASIAMFFPFWWSLITSLRPNAETISGGLSLWPKELIWTNYINLFHDVDIFGAFFNTLFVTVVGMFTNLFFCSLAAYALVKFRFPGRALIRNVFLMAMMIPGIVLLVPQYMVTFRLKLVDTFAGVIIPGSIGTYGIFFMSQFFFSIPNDMAEAARIDGSGELRIFAQIYLKMVVPGMITLGIFTFNGCWNSFLWPNIVIMDEGKMLLSVALRNYQIFYTENMGPLMAGSIIIVIPVFLIFVIGQKYFVQNMSFAGLKG